MKEETRVDGPWEFGERPIRRNVKEDWDSVLQAAKAGKFDEIPSEIYIRHYNAITKIARDNMQLPPDLEGCRGVWIYGEPGSGKTQWVKNRHPHESIYYKIANKWYDGYRPHEQEFILLDDLDPDRANMLTDRLKIWLDKNSYLAEVKGSALPCCPKLFYITSNYTIDECFKNEVDREAIKQRCKIIKHEAPLVPYVRKLNYDLIESEKAGKLNLEESDHVNEEEEVQIQT